MKDSNIIIYIVKNLIIFIVCSVIGASNIYVISEYPVTICILFIITLIIYFFIIDVYLVYIFEKEKIFLHIVIFIITFSLPFLDAMEIINFFEEGKIQVGENFFLPKSFWKGFMYVFLYVILCLTLFSYEDYREKRNPEILVYAIFIFSGLVTFYCLITDPGKTIYNSIIFMNMGK